MKRLHVFFCLSFVCLSSCHRVEYHRLDSYVGRYDDLTKIVLAANAQDELCIDVISDFNYQGCYMPGDAKYDALCRKYGDVGYNKKIASLSGRSAVYNASDLLSVKIFSDRDFDAEHPAGTSLADIVRFLSCSPKEYINSGYTALYQYDSSMLSESFARTWGYAYYWGKDAYECFPIDKMLCDVTQDDLVLLGPGLYSRPASSKGRFFSLSFTKRPSGGQVHKITVEITTEHGYVIRARLEMNFDSEKS